MLYVQRGLEKDLAMKVAEQLSAPDRLGPHMRDELGIDPSAEPRPPKPSAAFVFRPRDSTRTSTRIFFAPRPAVRERARKKASQYGHLGRRRAKCRSRAGRTVEGVPGRVARSKSSTPP